MVISTLDLTSVMGLLWPHKYDARNAGEVFAQLDLHSLLTTETIMRPTCPHCTGGPGGGEKGACVSQPLALKLAQP